MKEEKICCYSGSFDPITNGHMEIALKAKKIFDKVIILIADNSEKKYYFSKETRIKMAKEAFKDKEGFEVRCCQGLVVKEAKNLGAKFLIRGLRAVTDFEYENVVHATNEYIDSEIETIYFMSDKQHAFLSSSSIKELHKYGQDITNLVPKSVIENWGNKD